MLSRRNAPPAVAPRDPEDVTVTGRGERSRTLRRAIGKRLVLALLMTIIAMIAGWTLVPPEVGTDAATVYWYTH